MPRKSYSSHPSSPCARRAACTAPMSSADADEIALAGVIRVTTAVYVAGPNRSAVLRPAVQYNRYNRRLIGVPAPGCRSMIRRVCLTAAFVALAAARASDIGQQQPPPSLADPHLQGRGRVRRGRRARHRRAGPVHPRPDEGRLPGLRGRAAPDDQHLHARRHADRARRSAALRRGADRARRASPTSGRSTAASTSSSSTTCTPTRSARTHVKTAMRAVHRAQPRRQRPDGGRPHRRPHRRGAGVHEQQAAAPGVGRQVHGPEAAVSATLARNERVLPAARRGACRARGSPIPTNRSAPTTRSRRCAR